MAANSPQIDRLEEVKVQHLSFQDLHGIIPDQLFKEVKDLAARLQGKTIIQVNATAYGGGVAEILKSLVPYCNDLGVQTRWLIMPPDDGFFEVTKSFHNALQGAPFEFTEQAKETYLKQNKLTAERLSKEKADVFVIHDPQPAAVIGYLPELHPSIWRCHIDTTESNDQLWNFLKDYVNQYDKYIFTMEQYVHPTLDKTKLVTFTPTIDPLTPKNTQMGRPEAAGIVAKFGIDISRPLVSQISRFDPWKDPLGVIEAYRIAKEQFPELQLALVGSMASDDPEGQKILDEVKASATGDEDIHILTNLDGVRDREVNAFQTISAVVLQKSIREGFGLTVAEAMWKGTPVIGGKVGGITMQIQDGHTGFLVESIQECAQRLTELLSNPHKAGLMAERGQEYVREHFLMARVMRDYFKLYLELLHL